MPIQPKGKTLTYDDIQEIMSIVPLAVLQETYDYLHDNHWRGGDGWIGWKPALAYGAIEEQIKRMQGTALTSSVLNWLKLQQGFVFKNVCGNMVDTLRGAVLGKEPDFDVVSTEAKPELDPEKEATREKTTAEKEFEEIDSHITGWWSKRGIHEKLKEFFADKTAYGKSGLRIYIPKAYVNESGKIDGNTFPEILDKIFVEVPAFGSVIDDEDDAYGERYAIVEMKKANASDSAVYEICFVDENKKTVLRQVRENEGQLGQTAPTPENGNNSNAAAKELTLNLGGNLLTYVKGDYSKALISPSIKSLQRGVNHALSMSNYAVADANFPEMTFTNAEIDEEEVISEGGKKIKVAKSLPQGSGTWKNLIGKAFGRADGSEDIKTPGVHFRESKLPEIFDKAADNRERDMFNQANMGWVKISDSPYPSGNSRIQSMTGYLILLIDHKTMTDTTIVWLLTTVIRLVFHFLNQAQKNDKFRVTASSRLTIGQLSPEDKRIMMEEVNNGLRRATGYIVEAGVSDDPEMELKVIKVEQTVKTRRDAENAKLAAEINPPVVSPNGNGKPAPANVS